MTWSTGPLAIVPLALMITLYAFGFMRLQRISRIGRRHLWRLALFLAAVGVLAVALISPLDGLGDALFSAHMAQHVALMLPAAFLLVVAAPLPVMLLGIPSAVRRVVAASTAHNPTFRRLGGWLIVPWVSACTQMVVLWGWHAPTLFRAAQANDGVHALMHITFLGSAVLFWWSIVAAAFRPGHAPLSAVFPIALTVKLSSILGLILLLSPKPFYPEVYAGPAAAWGTTALEDQQLASIIMMAPGMLAYLAAGIAPIALWLKRRETSDGIAFVEDHADGRFVASPADCETVSTAFPSVSLRRGGAQRSGGTHL